MIITVAILCIVKESAGSIYARMMDAVDPEVVDSIEKSAAEVPGVAGIKAVRARWVGHRLHSEVELYLAGDLSVAGASTIKEQTYSAVKQKVPALERLVVEPTLQAQR